MSEPASIAVADVMRRALAEHEVGNIAKAAALYELVLEHYEEVDALHLLGVASYQRGRFAHSAALIDKAISLNPLEATYRFSRAECAYLSGDEKYALGVYSELVAADPTDETLERRIKRITNPPTGWRRELARSALRPDLGREICVIDDFLAADGCDAIVHAAANSRGSALGLMSRDRVDERIRRAERIVLPQGGARIEEAVRKAALDIAGTFYDEAVDYWEVPQLLRYTKGGHYLPHCDSESMDSATGQWRRTIDRDYSILIYLNEDFEGGVLQFPEIGLEVRPKKGLLLIFPSDHRYMHGVEPVRSGVRYAVASWLRTKNGAASGAPEVRDVIRP